MHCRKWLMIKRKRKQQNKIIFLIIQFSSPGVSRGFLVIGIQYFLFYPTFCYLTCINSLYLTKIIIMKKITTLNALLIFLTIMSCNKANVDQVSLTPSTTVASVGQTISVTVITNTNAVSWSVTPSAAVNKQYAVTTQKVNYFTFSSAGKYSIGVRARDIAYDSTRHQSLDSCWRTGGGDRGGCKRGVDSASVTITVK
jgi:hypothetical protein